MADSNDAFRLADKLGAAISSRDADRIRALYAEDIVVWHPAFDKTSDKTENSALLAKVFAVTGSLGYEEIRRYPIENGVVQQHVLNGTFADGSPLPRLQTCMIIKVRDGKITRIDEYFDAATFNPVWDRLATA